VFSVTRYSDHQGVLYFTNNVQFDDKRGSEIVLTPKTKVQPSYADITALTHAPQHYFQTIQMGKLMRKQRMKINLRPKVKYGFKCGEYLPISESLNSILCTSPVENIGKI